MSENQPAAGARPHVVRGGALVVLLTLSMLLAHPAGAETIRCQETWSDLALWSAMEERQGVSTETLQALRSLQPELDACASGGGAGMGQDAERWRLLAGVYFSPEDLDQVICLMQLESGGNPQAENPSSGAAGLMQVMPEWAGVFGYQAGDLFNPVINLWVASQILEMQGWGAWTPYLRGSCR